jgi:hypothetical protein
LWTFQDAFSERDRDLIRDCRFSWPDDQPAGPKLKEVVDFMLVPNPVAQPDVCQVRGILAVGFPALIDP